MGREESLEFDERQDCARQNGAQGQKEESRREREVKAHNFKKVGDT